MPKDVDISEEVFQEKKPECHFPDFSHWQCMKLILLFFFPVDLIKVWHNDGHQRRRCHRRHRSRRQHSRLRLCRRPRSLLVCTNNKRWRHLSQPQQRPHQQRK